MLPLDPISISDDRLMLWVMHRFSEVFKDHVLLKGGVQLMLMSSERATNDIDYIFVPYDSKKQITPIIEKILNEVPEVKIRKSLHSTAGRYEISSGHASLQIEFNVSMATPSACQSTELLASRLNETPRIIRVMAPEVAFAHKLAAWNERRLMRDLYDAYYWFAIARVLPDVAVLTTRLHKFSSRLPALKKIKRMEFVSFCDYFSDAIGKLTVISLKEELAAYLPPEKLEGLLSVLAPKLAELEQWLRSKL